MIFSLYLLCIGFVLSVVGTSFGFYGLAAISFIVAAVGLAGMIFIASWDD